MNKKENAKYMDVPIIQKGKIYKNESKDGKNGKLLTATLVIIIVILLMFCGYSMAKIIGEVIIRGQAQIAEPILVIENNPSIDITETKKYGEYCFKVKNYNNQKQTEIDLKYYIQVISDLDKSIELKLYENGKQIKFENNKTDYIKISKDSKKENEYKLEITYNKDKSVSVNDIVQQIQVKVHTEQEKA